MSVFRANVELFKSQGLIGRNTPTVAGYRPHVVVVGTETMLGVKFLESMKFGDNDVIFESTFKGTDYSNIQKDTKFEVKEGNRVVASGQIIERVD